MGKCGRRLFAVQSSQGKPDAAAGADVSAPTPVRADGAPTAPQRETVPAELSARQLARLFILGYRARSVRVGTPLDLRKLRRRAGRPRSAIAHKPLAPFSRQPARAPRESVYLASGEISRKHILR